MLFALAGELYRNIVNRCFMCLQQSETNKLLFLCSPIVAEIWNMFLYIFGLRWFMPLGIKHAYECWSLWKVDKTVWRIWKMISSCIFGVFGQKGTTRILAGYHLLTTLSRLDVSYGYIVSTT